MTRFKPYHCLNYYLDRQAEWAANSDPEHGFYVVLWWQTIPLGEIYIRPGEPMKQEHMNERMFQAILPAFKNYFPGLEPASLTEAIHLLKENLHPEKNIPPVCDVSLVICTKDRAESLKTCLQSLQTLLCKPSEIIVVDNATKDDSTYRVASQFTGVKYVREDRKGLDIARNTGAKAATKEIIIYTDDDTILHPLWVFHTVKTFDDPSVDAMTGLVLAHELKSDAQWIFEKYWPFNRGFVDKRYDQNFFAETLPTGPPVWNIGAGANMAFRKSTFAKAGYFDERLDVGAAGCNGDSEMWYRVLANGGAIVYNPRAVVSHFHRESMDKLQQQIFSYMRGFTAAVLIQYQRFGHVGNLKHLFLELPKYYVFLTARGFPFYRGRFTTVFSEMRGLFSGLLFFLKHRNSPSNTNHE